MHAHTATAYNYTRVCSGQTDRKTDRQNDKPSTVTGHTYQVSRIKRESHVLAFRLTLSRLEEIFSLLQGVRAHAASYYSSLRRVLHQSRMHSMMLPAHNADIYPMAIASLRTARALMLALRSYHGLVIRSIYGSGVAVNYPANYASRPRKIGTYVFNATRKNFCNRDFR